MSFKKPYQKHRQLNPNLNEGIRARELRVIFPDGTPQILPIATALQSAKDAGLDLVLIAPNSVPPVAKLVEYGKYQYEQKKRKQEAKANQHVIKVKELKFRPGTEEHDYDFKRNHAVNFLKEKHKVKAIVQFKGREVTHANLGLELLQRLLTDVADVGKAEFPPRQEGKQAFVMIVPK
jgi:translation initiation factor IF-3